MPYRIDIVSPPDDVLDRLVQVGAIDVEVVDGGVAAIIPDSVPEDAVARVLGRARASVSPAIGRDDGSVWMLLPQPVRVAGSVIALTDSTVFGTGHHPTTALCIEAIEEVLSISVPESILDVGTGSGVLALAALMLGVPHAVGLDIDPDALQIAAEHAQLNGMTDRLKLVHGGPDSLVGTWPLVVANVIAAPLIEMAPEIVRRVGHQGRLILSGIPQLLQGEVAQAYRWLGMRAARCETRAGWTVIMLDASW